MWRWMIEEYVLLKINCCKLAVWNRLVSLSVGLSVCLISSPQLMTREKLNSSAGGMEL